MEWDPVRSWEEVNNKKKIAKRKSSKEKQAHFSDVLHTSTQTHLNECSTFHSSHTRPVPASVPADPESIIWIWTPIWTPQRTKGIFWNNVCMFFPILGYFIYFTCQSVDVELSDDDEREMKS
jgi:hypothetical protein